MHANRTTILLVEDDSDIADVLAEVLGEAGYTVTHAERARDVHARLLRQPPDLLLLDLGLPNRDGMEVCRSVHRQQPDLPIVILAARSGTEDVVAGLHAGADDYIAKPFDRAVLLARIGAVLRGRRVQRAMG